MKRRLRLRRRGEFQEAISGKRFHSGEALVAFAVPNQALQHRVGVTVSRAVKGAVDRNRARRRLREVSRLTLLGADSPLHKVGIRYDVVLIARQRVLEMPFAELMAEASLAAHRLARAN
jgi:ribonuclease P protein component